MRGRVFALFGLACVCVGPSGAGAQAHRVGPTLRFGTGLLDVPVASVLPHGRMAVTFSGFRLALDRAPVVDASGDLVGYGEPVRRWYGDGSIAVGLWDRLEGGISVQEAGETSLVGGFGRLALLRPENGGIGLAVGARYVAASGSGVRVPGRLGIPDARLVARHPGRRSLDTELTPYAVATGTFQGPRSSLFPAYDVTVSVGVGGGLFADGADLPFYAAGNSDGWFAGSALHLGLGSGRLLTLMAEYNGFEVNGGVMLDLQELRVGTALLGLNEGQGVSVYRSRKLALLASVAVCPGGGGLRCRPEGNGLLERARTEAIVLPAPPPDTVVRPPTPPRGNPLSLCLATGRDVVVEITSAGDTLVGPGRVSVRDAGGDLVFPGSYADGRPWYVPDQELEVGGVFWTPQPGTVAPRCTELRAWNALNGVPLFVLEGEGEPPARFHLPVQPGVWRVYLRRPPEGEADTTGPAAADGARPSASGTRAGGSIRAFPSNRPTGPVAHGGDPDPA